MTTKTDSGASEQSNRRPEGGRPPQAAAASSKLMRGLEGLAKSPFVFPLFFALLFFDALLPLAYRGIFFLFAAVLLAGLCAEEFAAFLRKRDYVVPPYLCFNASLIAVFIAFCWRPHPDLSPQAIILLPANAMALWLLTAVTLLVVFCTLMVALSLITEVSEKLASGLVSFLFACGGSIVIGLAFGHLLLLQQLVPGDPVAPLVAVGGGWALTLVARLYKGSGDFQLLRRFAGLGVLATALFWGLYTRIY